MKKTITKVLAELKSEKPDLSYIRGLLEGLVEDEPTAIMGGIVNMPAPMFRNYDPINIKSDEQEEIPAHLRPGPISNLS